MGEKRQMEVTKKKWGESLQGGTSRITKASRNICALRQSSFMGCGLGSYFLRVREDEGNDALAGVPWGGEFKAAGGGGPYIFERVRTWDNATTKPQGGGVLVVSH